MANTRSVGRPAVTRRLASVIALLAPLVALAVGVVALARDTVPLIIMILAVPFTAVSIWFTLTRRRLLRWLGLLGAAVGLAALIYGALHHVLPIVIVIGLVILFGLAARYALGHDHRMLLASAARHTRVPPARRGVVIINPKSGGGKAEAVDLAGRARRMGLRVVPLGPGDDLRQLAEQAIASGADVLGMAGGDGSQALVAMVAAEHDRAYVCVPAGTRNHFALDLGLDRDDVAGALDAFTDGVERRVDLARVNGRVFVNNASLGVYAKVVQSDAYRDAKLATWARQLPDMLGPQAPPIDLQFNGPDSTGYADAPLILVSNNPYQLAQLAGAGSRIRLDGGCLGILAARVHTAFDVAQLAALETAGQSGRFPGLLSWHGPSFEVRSDCPVPVGLDGEAIILQPPLRFTCLPGALRIRLPRHAAGLSPAAINVAPARPTFTALLHVAAGHPVVTQDPAMVEHPVPAQEPMVAG